MYAQCDPDGNPYVLFGFITDSCQSTTTLCYADKTVKKADGRTFLRRSTDVWKLCVLCKDGSTSSENLLNLKELHPLDRAEYAVSQSLECELAFNWWVQFSLKKRDCIIYLRQTHQCTLSETQRELWN